MRAPSPTSTLLAPSKSPFRLSIAEQFEFVKPVLVAVLQGKYDPVRARHEAFMGSGASRRNVCDTNHHKGDLRARDVEELDVIVRQWVRRRQKRQDLGFVPRDEPDDPDPQNTLTVVEVCLWCVAICLVLISYSTRKTHLLTATWHLSCNK